MKIAIFSDSFFPLVDGGTISIKNNAEILSKKNKIFFFIPSKSQKLNIKNSQYIQLKSYGLESYKGYKIRIPSFLKVYFKLKKIRPDIIHMHSIFGISWEGLIASKILKIPSVTTSHTIFSEATAELYLGGFEKTKIFQKITWAYMRFFLNLNDFVITPSEIMKKELIAKKIKKPIYSISNGIDINKFPKVTRNKKEKISFVYVGRFAESKHIYESVKAFNLALKKGIKADFLIFGVGPQKEKIKNYIKKNNLDKKIKLLGFLEHEKILRGYKKTDVFVTSSTIETEGISTLEAMSTGLPVIGVNVRATPLLIKNAGIVVPNNNEEKMADAMIKLATNYKLRQKLGENASKIAKKYDLKEMNKKLFNLYKKIIKDYKK